MLNKLKNLREEHEDGFTLIELLVVILIIGILAAIAIPVFLNQRQTANDGAVESDVKNASTQVETWIVGEKGKKTDLTQALVNGMGIKKSGDVTLTIRGNSNAYCIEGLHANGKKYKTGSTLKFSNDGGSMSTTASGACALAAGAVGTTANFTVS